MLRFTPIARPVPDRPLLPSPPSSPQSVPLHAASSFTIEQRSCYYGKADGGETGGEGEEEGGLEGRSRVE